MRRATIAILYLAGALSLAVAGAGAAAHGGWDWLQAALPGLLAVGVAGWLRGRDRRES